MARFLIPILSPVEIRFLHKFGLNLQSRGHSVEYILPNVISIVNPARAEIIDMNLNVVHETDIGSTEIHSKIREIEKKYHVDSFWNFIFAESIYNVHRNTNDLAQEFIHSFNYCEDLMERKKFDYVLQYMGGEILKRVLQRVCESKGLASIWIGFSPIKDHFSLYSNEKERWDRLRITEYDNLTKEEIENSKEYLAKFRGEGEMQLLMKSNRAMIYRNGSVPTNSIKGLIREWRISHQNSPEVLNYIFRRLKKRINLALRRAYCLLFLYPSMEASKEIISDEEYFFLPLQLRIESRITVRAPFFYNPDYLVDIVSRSVPYDYMIIIKDHPEWIADLPLSVLRRMRKNRNVRFINPRMNSHEVIKSAIGVVLINNTAGFESILYRKPVITFGASFYTDCGLTIDVRNFDMIPSAFSEAIRINELEEERVISFLAAIQRASYSGIYNDIDDGNIIAFGDSILAFISCHPP